MRPLSPGLLSLFFCCFDLCVFLCRKFVEEDRKFSPNSISPPKNNTSDITATVYGHNHLLWIYVIYKTHRIPLPYFHVFFTFEQTHLLSHTRCVCNTHTHTILPGNLYAAHWTHISMYLYSNTHTLTQCPSLSHPTPPLLRPLSMGILSPSPSSRKSRAGPHSLKKRGGRGRRGV